MTTQAIGPTTAHVAAKVRTTRLAATWSQQELAKRLSEATGATWLTPTVSRLESGIRQITVEDIHALTLVFREQAGWWFE